MCEELSACAVMTDGAGSHFQQEVIKKSNFEVLGRDKERAQRSRDTERRIGPNPSNDKGNQSAWKRFGRRKVLFPPRAV